MGAEVPYKVRVLRTVEDVVEVSAVTSSDAMFEATSMPGVVAALGIVYDEGDCRYELTDKGRELLGGGG